jgi:hypothetical protein
MPKSVGVTCLLALTTVCSAALAKTALAQDFTGAVYAGTDAQQNGLVAYSRKYAGERVQVTGNYDQNTDVLHAKTITRAQ